MPSLHRVRLDREGFDAMQDADNGDRLRQLEQRIDALKEAQAPAPETQDHYTAAQTGWRMVTELVAGLLIGFGIGYGLDAIFGTLPIFTVLFVFAGFAAGIKVMIRTASELQSPDAPGAETGSDSGPGDGKKEG